MYENTTMLREKLNQLIAWKDDPYRKPLLVYGARQTGKTYLCRDIFAAKYFDKVVYIDFVTENEIRRFIRSHVNAAEIIRYISIQKNITIDEHTLLIFDEIQECMQVITALKYFCQEFRQIPVIATGSMVRIRLKQIEQNKHRSDSEESEAPFLFPIGKIDEMSLYPMTFSEYLLNANESLHTYLKECFLQRKDPGNEYHELAMRSFQEYMLLGGMPEAVDLYLTTGSMQRALQSKKVIYDNYLNDMSLYQISSETLLRTRRVYDHVYTQLSKENKNFKISELEKNKRFRDYNNAIDWLREARVVYPSYQLKEHISVPLKEQEESLFRLYMSDSGLFSMQSRIMPETILDQNTLSGIFYENYIADELVAHDIDLFYWKGKTSSELEFLVEHHGTVIPIDVKKNKGPMKPLAKYKEMNSCSLAVKVSQNHYGWNEENQLLTLPYYYVSFWLDELNASPTIPQY